MGLIGSMLGELTDQGRVTTMALGERIRRLYVDKLGFLPPTLEDENILYLRFFPFPTPPHHFRGYVKLRLIMGRSSHIQRTIESMTQLFSGLYPKNQAKAIPNFHVRLVNHENLYPNDDFCAYPPHPTLARIVTWVLII